LCSSDTLVWIIKLTDKKFNVILANPPLFYIKHGTKAFMILTDMAGEHHHKVVLIMLSATQHKEFEFRCRRSISRYGRMVFVSRFKPMHDARWSAKKIW
jgi:tRNA1(Val) A37 N6-methylase TrmN6